MKTTRNGRRGGVHKDERVLIVGAGAAGLSVAHRLAERGYRRVTVLEASDRVGGKCSVSPPPRPLGFEMGAIGFPGRRSAFLRLAALYGLPTSLTATYCYASAKGSTSLPPLSLRSPWEALRLCASLLPLQRSGFVGIDAGLAVPMHDWLATRRLGQVGDALRPLVTGLGYGFFHDIAAAYAMKHIALFRPDAYQLLDGGSQRVWEHVAATLDVRKGHPVQRVIRTGSTVRVDTKGGATFEGEHLFVATPPRMARAFLDVSDDERRLLERFRSFAYHTLLCEVSGLRGVHYGFFTDAHERLQHARPVAYAKRYPDSATTAIYSYLDPTANVTPEEIVASNAAYLEPLGARIGEVHRQHTWDYFPHVAPRDIGDGFFDAFDTLQGRSRTYYVGEALAYPTVRHVVTHAFDLVDRFF